MIDKLPIYAPVIDKYSFDSDRMILEFDKFIGDKLQERTLPFENGKSVYDPAGKLKIASDEELNNTTKYYLDENGKRVAVEEIGRAHV